MSWSETLMKFQLLQNITYLSFFITYLLQNITYLAITEYFPVTIDQDRDVNIHIFPNNVHF